MAVDESPGAGRVLIADAAGPLVAEPSWTRYDDLGSECRNNGFDWTRGRQSEFDVTNTGTARVYFHDLAGTFADESLIGCQIMLQLYDPVTASWQPVFRGHIDDLPSSPSPGAPELTNVQVDCVDVFDYLGGAKFVVGVMGDAAPSGMTGVVFYEDGPVDDRITALLTDAGLASSMIVVFTGNVDVNETLYDPDDVILRGLREAADAEFPGIANVYVDRYGRVAFHGRFARFDPDGTASGAEWDFQRWQAATRDDVSTTRAQIRDFTFNRPRSRIVNSFVAWPREDENGVTFDQALTETLVRTDATSISTYGYRGTEKPDLIIKEHKTNGNTGADECGLFGDFWTLNYSVPRKNIQTVTFKSIRPSDARAPKTWELMTKMDISDVVHLFVDEAGLSDEQFFVEGMTGSCRPARPAFDMVTVTPNLSPQAYYTDNVFGS